MADTLTPKKRSWNMSRIRSKDTKPEKIVRSLLHKNGYRFRLHNKNLPGRPDIILKKYGTVIFCHGCFWHQHPGCKRATIPKSNTKYWIPKLERNVSRFNNVQEKLLKLGWRIMIVWECETKDLEKLISKLDTALKGLNDDI